MKSCTDTGKANWIGDIFLRKFLLEHIIDGNIGGRIEVRGRRRKRRKHLLYDVKENKLYWKLKKKSLWKWLRTWTCRKRDLGKNGYLIILINETKTIICYLGLYKSLLFHVFVI
jgi:hypothetical protein